MRIARPLLLVTTPLGLLEGFYECYRLAGGLLFLMVVECAAAVDSLDLHRRALDLGISIAPGPIFSARQQFKNYLRLNTGHPWTDTMVQAIQKLAQLLKRSNHTRP